MADAVPPAAPPSAPSEPEETVRMYDPSAKQYGQIPKSQVEAARKGGLEPAWAGWESGLAGVEHGATLGFADELVGAAKALPAAAGAVKDVVTGAKPIGEAAGTVADTYAAGRDAERDRLAAARTQKPMEFLGGQLVGGIAPAVATGAASLPAFAALGAAQGIGESEAPLASLDTVKDAAIGGAAGAALPGVLKAGGAALRAASSPLANAAGKLLMKGAKLDPADLGSTPAEAARVAQAALREPGVVPNVMSLKGATADTLAETAKAATGRAGAAMGAVTDALDAQGANIGAHELGQRIQATAAAAVRDKPELHRHVERAVRLINPEAFDAAKEALKAAKDKAWRVALKAKAQDQTQLANQRAYHDALEVYRQVKGQVEVSLKEPWRLLPDDPMPLSEVQDVINRMRGLGAYPKGAVLTGEELTAKKDVYSPAWNAGAGALRDAARAVGGPEAEAAVNASRTRYADMISLQEAAEAAQGRARTGSSETAMKLAKAGAGAAGGALTGGPVGAAVGAAVPALTEAVVLPRAARAVDNMSRASGEVPDAVKQFSSAFGSLFASHPPEKRAQLDMMMQERNPRYRELRKAADKEDNAAAQGLKK